MVRTAAEDGEIYNRKITISKVPHDISNVITEDIPIYPGNPNVKFESILSLEKDGVNVSRFSLGTHTGTHIDSQIHFISNGNGIDSEPIAKFIGEATILDFSKKEMGSGIGGKDLSSYSSITRADDIMLLYTGASYYWNKNYKEKVGNRFTYLEPSAADWIVDNNIKSIGIDTLSIEKYGSTQGITHKKLLSAGIGIIENLSSNIKKFIGRRVFLVCLPLALEGLDGSPARAVIFDIIEPAKM